MLNTWALIALVIVPQAPALAQTGASPAPVAAALASGPASPPVSDGAPLETEGVTPKAHSPAASSPQRVETNSKRLEPSPNMGVDHSAIEAPFTRLQGELPRTNDADPRPVDFIARGVAVAGFLIAFLNFLFTFYKMDRDRRLSVEDDFWFRKIISPSTIEPLLKSIADILETVPTEKSTPDEKREFAVKITTRFQALSSSMEPLALLYPELPGKVVSRLRICEDVLTEYAAAISNIGENPSEVTVDGLRSGVWKQIGYALNAVREEQVRQTFSVRDFLSSRIASILPK